MKKTLICFVSIALAFWITGNALAQSHSGEALKESGKAASAAGKSAAHSIAASGQTTSAASAVPLALSGAAGAVSGKVGKDLAEAANQPIGTSLEITDETVTAGPPPDQVLKVKKSTEN